MQVRTDFEALYPDHIAILKKRLSRALEDCGLSGLLIASGTPKGTFLDDHTYPFVVNPHFKAWVPLVDVPDSFLLLRPGDTPVLFYNQPADYWHKPPADPSGYWTGEWDIHTVADTKDVHNLLGDTAGLGFVGEETDLASSWGIDEINSQRLLDRLHFERAYKTPFEIAALQLANLNAAKGHRAAEAAFREGRSEFDIQHAYLGAITSREQQTPYSSIVALNENCAVLHYQHYETRPPETVRSMLIDAGASMNGYAADITRTYAAEQGMFADLVARMDEEQRGIIDEISAGMNYRELHERMHRRLASVLRDFELVNMSVDAMIESNLTFTFMPHGLGHLLGLQTHDVGGFQQNREGETKAAPDAHPALRLTRPIEDNQVFTIEPGLYFIPMLLSRLRDTSAASRVNWQRIDSLLPFGGIRIEDNILVRDGAAINLTRDAFAAHE